MLSGPARHALHRVGLRAFCGPEDPWVAWLHIERKRFVPHIPSVLVLALHIASLIVLAGR